MGKPSRRVQREAEKKKNKDRKQEVKRLNKILTNKGLKPASGTIIFNRKSSCETVEEERLARNETVADSMRIFKKKLPVLLRRFKKIKDPRNPKKVKHKVTVLMIYGLLMFILQLDSRREVNRTMAQPMFMANLKVFFPEVEDLPHNDTLARFLASIDVKVIEDAQVDLVNSLIRNKKFKDYLVDGCYPIAFDGSQKFARDYLWSDRCSERTIKGKKGKDPKMQYYVYVLEASLAFQNGMTIPLMSEFADYTEGYTESDKQDCEQKAFKRLAKRVKERFPKLKIMVLLDGLYPNGPMIEMIQRYKWDGMIVLQDKSLPSVWEDFYGLKKLLPKNKLPMNWGGRCQKFKWVNDIEYSYGSYDENFLKFHMVVCEEKWEEVGKESNKIETKKSRHAWISLKPLDINNLHERCNLGARHRWNIEHGFLVEKHHGYQYEHCFSYNWTAMKGFHYLMRIGHVINILVQFSERFNDIIQERGVRGLIKYIRGTLSAPWLDSEWLEDRLAAPFQLRFR
ncbi:MAG: transposase family protein [Desulfobacteraceae bacterium]|nr:transposase family protein [Desulfobacteraceae bacterium]